MTFPMPGNAFAQQKELQRLRELEKAAKDESAAEVTNHLTANDKIDATFDLPSPALSSFSAVLEPVKNKPLSRAESFKKTLKQPRASTDTTRSSSSPTQSPRQRSAIKNFKDRLFGKAHGKNEVRKPSGDSTESRSSQSSQEMVLDHNTTPTPPASDSEVTALTTYEVAVPVTITRPNELPRFSCSSNVATPQSQYFRFAGNDALVLGHIMASNTTPIRGEFHGLSRAPQIITSHPSIMSIAGSVLEELADDDTTIQDKEKKMYSGAVIPSSPILEEPRHEQSPIKHFPLISMAEKAAIAREPQLDHPPRRDSVLWYRRPPILSDTSGRSLNNTPGSKNGPLNLEFDSPADDFFTEGRIAPTPWTNPLKSLQNRSVTNPVSQSVETSPLKTSIFLNRELPLPPRRKPSPLRLQQSPSPGMRSHKRASSDGHIHYRNETVPIFELPATMYSPSGDLVKNLTPKLMVTSPTEQGLDQLEVASVRSPPRSGSEYSTRSSQEDSNSDVRDFAPDGVADTETGGARDNNEREATRKVTISVSLDPSSISLPSTKYSPATNPSPISAPASSSNHNISSIGPHSNSSSPIQIAAAAVGIPNHHTLTHILQTLSEIQSTQINMQLQLASVKNTVTAQKADIETISRKLDIQTRFLARLTPAVPPKDSHQTYKPATMTSPIRDGELHPAMRPSSPFPLHDTQDHTRSDSPTPLPRSRSRTPIPKPTRSLTPASLHLRPASPNRNTRRVDTPMQRDLANLRQRAERTPKKNFEALVKDRQVSEEEKCRGMGVAEAQAQACVKAKAKKAKKGAAQTEEGYRHDLIRKRSEYFDMDDEGETTTTIFVDDIGVAVSKDGSPRVPVGTGRVVSTGSALREWYAEARK